MVCARIGPGADYAAASTALARLLPSDRRRPDAADEITERLRRHDADAPGAVAAPIWHPVHPDIAAENRRVRDVAYTRGHSHASAMRRRERKRLAELLQSTVRADGTCGDLQDPLWASLPEGAPPLSLHPAAMWAARPSRRTVFSGLTQHPSRLSARVKHWQRLHAVHCSHCRRYSQLQHGSLPPRALATAYRDGWQPPPQPWSLDPACYIRRQSADLYAGFDPEPTYQPPPRRVANAASFWDHWDAGTAYLSKMDELEAVHSKPVWHPPPDAVISALAVIVRPSDLRHHQLDPTEDLPARTVQDITGSGANECFPDAKFRMAGIDHGVTLLFDTKQCHVGSLDLSKFFPSVPAAPALQRLLWVKDPRADTKWRGTGKPSQSWLAFQRRAAGLPRRPPYFRSLGMALGFKLAPFLASCLSAEMTMILNSLGVRSFLYCDDFLVVGETYEECATALAVADAVFRYLGFRCAAAKRRGPTRRLLFLGYILDLDDGTVGIGAERRGHIATDLRRALASGRIGTDSLESLLGRLGFVATVMTGGASYTYRLRRLFLEASLCRRRVSLLTAPAAADAEWWLRHLDDPAWPGSRVFYKEAPLPLVTLKSDASGTFGYGYIYDGSLFFSRYSAAAAALFHVGAQELEAVCHCVLEHGSLLTGTVTRVGVDNCGVVYSVLKGTSTCATMQALLRMIADVQILHHFTILPVHVKRHFNTIADLASRFIQVAEFDANGQLPPGVAIDFGVGSLRRCRRVSPLSREPVFSVNLRLQGGPASPPRHGPAT